MEMKWNKRKQKIKKNWMKNEDESFATFSFKAIYKQQFYIRGEPNIL